MTLPTILRRGAIALLVIGAIAAAIWFATRPKPIAVVLKAIDRGTVEATVVNTRAGTIEACQRTRRSMVTGGRIELLAVKEGDRVAKGQLLMKLWNDDQRAQQTLAEAQRKVSRQS